MCNRGGLLELAFALFPTSLGFAFFPEAACVRFKLPATALLSSASRSRCVFEAVASGASRRWPPYPTTIGARLLSTSWHPRLQLLSYGLTVGIADRCCVLAGRCWPRAQPETATAPTSRRPFGVGQSQVHGRP
jgi:hypothetical protein